MSDDSNRFIAVFGSQGGSGGGGGGSNDKVKISSADTTTDFLENKLVEGKGLSLTKQNVGANENILVDNVITRIDDGLGTSLNYASGNQNTLGGFSGISTTGNNNTAIGLDVFNVGTSLTNSVGIGDRVAPSIVTASQLTALGSNTLTNLTSSGNEQVAIGSNVLNANTGNVGGALTGDFNVSIGTDSSTFLDGGARNTALGHNSAGALTTGSRNLVLGFEAGLSPFNNLTTGNDNILIGYQADSDGDENLIIGNNAFSQVGSVLANQNTIVGNNCNVNSANQVVMGYNADVINGGQDTLIGFNVRIDGSAFPTFPTLATHVGSQGTFTGFYNQTLGYNHTITGDDNNAIGNFITITGNDNVAIGNSLTLATTQTYGLGVDSSSYVDYSFQVSWNDGVTQFDDIRLVSKASSVIGQKSFLNVKSDLTIDAVGGVLISTGDITATKQLKQNNFLLGTLTTATTLDWSNGNIQEMTLGANITLNNPTNTGQSVYYLIIRQDGVGSRTITWGTNWKWENGTPPTLTTNPARADILMFVSDGTNIFGRVFGQLYV